MSGINRNIKKRRLMDKIEQEIDSHAVLLNQRDYALNSILTEFYINDNSWLVSQKPGKLGIFKKVKPRVK